MNPRSAAIAAVRAQLGLNDIPSSWTYDQRVEYNKALANYISTHPALFTPQDLATASDIAVKAYAPLADTSTLADIGQFGENVLDNVIDAGNEVADVGRGALTGISIAGMAIPVLVVVGLGLVIWIAVGKAQTLRTS